MTETNTAKPARTGAQLNAFTVDVEDYFHVAALSSAIRRDSWSGRELRVEANTDRLLGILAERQVRATFFVLGWVAMRYPRLVEQILAAGHEVGSHGHLHRRVYDLTPEEFSSDLDAARRCLTQAGATTVMGFRAPEWSINDRSLCVLARQHYRFDSSMAPLRLIGNPAYPRVPHQRATSAGELTEYPPFVDRRFGQNIPLGGGWGLRMTTPNEVLRTIERRNRGGELAVVWVHPWEIDPEPPRARLPWPQRFAHYFRLDGFRQRLDELLAGGVFGPMGEALGHARPR
jgi:polysaccharide deacetylase family protein (PEP-CTERM system associated)